MLQQIGKELHKSWAMNASVSTKKLFIACGNCIARSLQTFIKKISSWELTVRCSK